MQLRQAFGVSRGEVAAFVGAGGKTSLLVGLGYELAEDSWRVLATATTRIPVAQLDLYPCALPYDCGAATISAALSEHQFVFLYDRSSLRGDTVRGPGDEWMRSLLDSVDSDVLLVEADQAQGKPLKAPYGDEPRIPPDTTLVVPVASLAALGKPLDAEHVYNHNAIVERFGFVENSAVKSPWLAQVLRDEQLGLRHVPPKARVVIFLNRTPKRGFLRGRARMIARLSLQNPRIQAVALGEVRGAQPVYEVQRAVGAIVLAAGANASGMVSPMRGIRCPLRQVTEVMVRSRISHIRVAAGACASQARKAVKPLGIKVVASRARSPQDRARGKGGRDLGFVSDFPKDLHCGGEELAALKLGIRAMPEHVAAVMLVKGDHAQLTPRTIYHLLTAFARDEGDLLLPRLEFGISQPLLIGRRHWQNILALGRRDNLADVIEGSRAQLTHVDIRRRALAV